MELKMIFITGDTHGSIDIAKLKQLKNKNLTKSDFLIICGDFGCVWYGGNKDKYWLKWFNNKPYTVLFCDGNHENFNLLNNYPVEYFHGGKVHKIMPSVYHLMRGQVFDLNNNKIFVMGGAESTDKEYRKENISWWKNELPNNSEYAEAEKNLDHVDRNVDFIVTHCAPNSIQDNIVPYADHNKLTCFLEYIRSSVQYKHWYFGHYHEDVNIDGKYTLLYNEIIEIGDCVSQSPTTLKGWDLQKPD